MGGEGKGGKWRGGEGRGEQGNGREGLEVSESCQRQDCWQWLLEQATSLTAYLTVWKTFLFSFFMKTEK